VENFPLFPVYWLDNFPLIAIFTAKSGKSNPLLPILIFSTYPRIDEENWKESFGFIPTDPKSKNRPLGICRHGRS
jgi:hypothetical protein